ncbi:hypothetical protein BH23ACT4_BH23ACT4_09130 [soil metagenome]
MINMTITLETNKRAPSISRQKLAEFRGELEPRFDDLALVVSELVSNAVRHSGHGSVFVSLKQTGDNRVRLEVKDPGPCFDPEHPPGGDGMGLQLVSKVADSWGIENDGDCTVWVEIDLPGTT